MRTTINIKSELLHRLKAEATRTGLPLTRLVNQVLEAGLWTLGPPSESEARPILTFSLGEPSFDTDKALKYSALLEDEESLRKLDLRK